VGAERAEVDFYTGSLARSSLADLEIVLLVRADIARYSHEEPCDVVYCIGVIHPTDDTSRERVGRGFDSDDFEAVSMAPYRGVSWRANGVVRRV